MSAIYISQIVGDGTDKNPYRSAAHDHLVSKSYSMLACPDDAQGRPLKPWVLIDLDTTDFTVFDADANLIALADKVNLDSVPNTGQRNRINNFLGKIGATTTASPGDTYRVIANKLLAELGSQGGV